jgi:hypothetical protein
MYSRFLGYGACHMVRATRVHAVAAQPVTLGGQSVQDLVHPMRSCSKSARLNNDSNILNMLLL